MKRQTAAIADEIAARAGTTLHLDLRIGSDKLLLIGRCEWVDAAAALVVPLIVRAIAFSTAPQVRIRTENKALTRHIDVLTNDAMSPRFLAVIEATEEAAYNSIFRATTMTGRGHTVEALPIEKTTEVLKKYGAIK